MAVVGLHLYFERAGSGPVWWSESPEVPGFKATALDMQELILRSKLALADILEEDVELTVRLIGRPPGTEGDPVTTSGDFARSVGSTAGTPGVLVGVA